ncbi:MAG: ATPase AAA [Rhodothermaceae bacterium]|nr:MAG: ATPase AAA [Rhodothermaceae bacterium]
MPERLVNREVEVQTLRRLARSGCHLALLTGRRRVGKTFLLTHTWTEEPLFFFTASRTTPEINRRQLIEDLAAWSGEALHPEDYPTWRTVFRLLLDVGRPDPLVVVLDEFQYLGDDAGGTLEVASELNAVWERHQSDRPFLLVLSGSAVGTMEALAAGGGPLYGRFDWQHRLQPFGYWHAAEMTPFKDLRDRALTYGIFGGTPRYLAALDGKASLAQHVMRLMLDPSGAVRLLIETALEQEEGLRDVSKYRAILHAVASGCTERNDIATRTGLRNDRALRDKLERLTTLGYIETRRNIDARPNEPVRYGIADAAFRFYQRFVEPNRSMLEQYPAEEVWTSSVAPHLDAYMGHEFERIVAQAYPRLRAAYDLPMVAEWGRWEGTDRHRQSLEIDIVARRAEGGMLTGAIKWNRSPVPGAVHREHMEMLKRAAEAGRKWAHQALEPDAPLLYVAAGGFSEAFLEAASASGHPVTTWTLEDLYAKWKART